jgi:hypothetical protein
MDMLSRFFKNDTNPTVDTKRQWAACGGAVPKWRFKRHAEMPFWRWVCSWARACRRPEDLGFKDDSFKLPPLLENSHCVESTKPRPGLLFNLPAVGLSEQREERRRTITERCEKAAELASAQTKSILWCHLNKEADLLESMVKGAVQVSGSQSDDEKEKALISFLNGDNSHLVTKPMCAGFGLNLQCCAHMTTFPSHSYESYYQSVRRCWRYGQKREVRVDVITTEGERDVMRNMQKKSAAADEMFTKLVECMNEGAKLRINNRRDKREEVPSWLSPIK